MLTPLSPLVKQFVQSPMLHHINGQATPGQTSTVREIVDPSTGKALTSVSIGTATEVETALAAAQGSFIRWTKTPLSSRAVVLQRFADLLERHRFDLAQIESLDVGKALVNSESFDIPFGIECVRYFANLLEHMNLDTPHALPHMDARTYRASYGVCGFIFPWNFPFDLLLWNIVPAISAGNTVVIKPSPQTPMSTLFVAKIAQEAGIPDGVINVVVGEEEAGKALAGHPLIKRMSFTGSTTVGMQIGETCGRNLVPAKLELGGKGAAVIFDDINVDSVAEALATAITFNTGQVCCTATRWLIHRNIRERLIDKVASILRRKKIGPALDRETQIGPLVSKAHLERISRYISEGKKQGATVLFDEPTAVPTGFEQGFYMGPTLLTGSSSNVCCSEEVFGPSAFVLEFSDESEAVHEVNSLRYGLANSVWSSDLERANRVAEQLEAGNNWINAHNVFAYGLPYRAINLSGLGGGVNSAETLLDYFRPMTIARPLS